IDFSVTGTINLSVGSTNSTKQITINKNLTISGPGANLLTIKAFDPTAAKNGDGSRVFTIDDSNANNLLNVSISGLTLTGGDVSATGGGAIFSAENLLVTDCAISNSNTTVSSLYVGGGGILSQAGLSKPNSLTVRNSTLSGNAAPVSEGGAIRQRYGTLV